MNNVTDISQLVGKTIVAAQRMKLKDCDDEGYLLLTFSDQSRALIVASYGSYTGKSEDEYPTFLGLTEDVENFLERLY